MKQLPLNAKIHNGYVLVEVFDKDTYNETLGMDIGEFEKDSYEDYVMIDRIGGNFFQRLWTAIVYGFQKGHYAITSRTNDNLMEFGERKFRVVFVEDIKISWCKLPSH